MVKNSGDGTKEKVPWYLMQIPLSELYQKMMSDNSIDFANEFYNEEKQPIVSETAF